MKTRGKTNKTVFSYTEFFDSDESGDEISHESYHEKQKNTKYPKTAEVAENGYNSTQEYYSNDELQDDRGFSIRKIRIRKFCSTSNYVPTNSTLSGRLERIDTSEELLNSGGLLQQNYNGNERYAKEGASNGYVLDSSVPQDVQANYISGKFVDLLNSNGFHGTQSHEMEYESYGDYDYDYYDYDEAVQDMLHDDFTGPAEENQESEASQISNELLNSDGSQEDQPNCNSNELANESYYDVDTSMEFINFNGTHEPPENIDNDTDEDWIKVATSSEESDSDDAYAAPAASDELKYNCDICGKALKGIRSLERHQRAHRGGDNSKCDICGKVYTRKEYLKKHIRSQHSKVQIVKEHECEVCGKLFAEVNLLRRHLETHFGSRVECEVCNKSFSNTRIMLRHLKGHYNQRDFKCEKCGKTFGRKDNLKAHMFAIHNKGDPVECDICGKSYPHYISLKRHKRTHTDLERRECGICGKFLKSKKLLERHMISHYGVKDFSCDICGKSFSRKDHIAVHRLIHTHTKDIECEICGKLFISQKALRGHKRFHAPRERKHVCNICDKTFLRARSLRKHLRAHRGVKDYKCEICGRLFQEKYGLQNHLSSLTHSKEVDKNCQFCQEPFGTCCHTTRRRFTCPICNKELTTSSILRAHMKTHTGEKKYKCHICDKSYTQNGNLKKHLKLHFGSERFECDICEKTFSRKDYLKEHKRYHGPKTIECHICKELVHTRTSLRWHMHRHNRDKTYECKVCSKVYSHPRTLSKHVKIHYRLPSCDSI